jgi:RimJ/RimL family protein N-acetyltransferase
VDYLHQISMELDLTRFDNRLYNPIIKGLKEEGFLFTSMAELGNTEEAQLLLYHLNNTTDLDSPGSDGIPSWESFEDFQNSVCRSSWYKPEGQIVAIDTSNDAWVAMSAITRFDGQDFGYNLHTGVDKSYRRRKLAQAVKVLALCYAREVLDVDSVRTHHNTLNHPMIAIDRKFGYVQKPGIFSMVKSYGQLSPP